jgi:hypothetical protein
MAVADSWASATLADTSPRLAGTFYADYASELREATPRADGYLHVNTPVLIQRLLEAKVTTYAFLVWNQPSDWDDFRLEFLPAAQAAQLNVWLYLTPPSENLPPSAYVPYGSNYVTWATEAAKLAQQYPALTALAIDDFDYDLDFFTPSYVSNMMYVAHAYCPSLSFLPVNSDLSHSPTFPTNIISPAFLDAYGAYCGGVIFPFLNWTNYGDLSVETAQILNNSDILQGKLAQFLVTFPTNTASQAGDFTSLSEYLVNDAGFTNTSYPFRFRVSNNYNGPTAGYHKLQVLVDSTVIWEADIAGATGIQDVTLDLKGNLAGKIAAALTVRFYEAQGVYNYGVQVSWNLPAGNWTPAETGALMGTGAYYPATPELSVPLVVMIYAGGYGTWKPTLDYLRQANLTAFSAVQTRRAGAIIQYCLDKSDSSQQIPLIQQLYGTWSSCPWFDPLRFQPDGSVLLSGANGPKTQGYTIRVSDSITRPFASWTLLTNGIFDGSGYFTNTDLGAKNSTIRFYRMSVP